MQTVRQSIAPSSAAADTNRPVTSADLLQFFQQMREEDNHRRDEENEENRRRDEPNRIFQEQSLSFQKLLMDRFGPSPANTSSQPSPSPSLGTQVEDETAKPSASFLWLGATKRNDESWRSSCRQITVRVGGSSRSRSIAKEAIRDLSE
ncbi:MAG: hypothetical protein SEPTF4163_003627 [Sporothrix epigloea]